ncbi:hypothetical protein COU15_01260 [Candidatus Kaiserbacteria bacterium CG10_big_fil_rev_8_21_14_0_10_45_20]|uniref:Major facilitator superfamily (MFS) profile domain-containing protein n=1 Tax=Candidatus Kaiserbacteria bacterium CG10_big_fil_rev_8_21_14_0_10_45_20 TaxID=1974607 RepID=A0A2H0UI46_9BACT|nr:MAG: hypothetical protein COU15_01260 [Candidatus Kaiserbacteria bacterium CG10_big_fil_rev_8_21_14_0_10_45_20]
MGRFKRVSTLIRAFTTLIVVNFVLNMYSVSVAYVSAPFLERFFSPETISMLFIIQSAAVLIGLLLIPTFISFIGVRALFIMLIPLLQLTVLFFGLAQDFISAAFFFIVQGIILYIIFYILDLYVEGSTQRETETGEVRAIFLTAGNIAGFFAPLIIALLVINEYYPPLFAFTTIILTPAFALALTAFRKLPTIAPKKNAFLQAIHTIRHCRPGVSYVLGANLLLKIFYSWIVIYAPLYLVSVAGISWQALGTMLALALFAYVILEIPLGFIADNYLGEKEIMVAGFLILGASTALLSFIPTAILLLWGIAFFTTRVGAAMVEISTEAHFFKKVTADDSALISVFRITTPLGFIIGPFVALLLLPITGLQFVFGFFGVILLVGAILASRIVDTR